MGVYIDDMEWPFGRMKMNHMIADTTDELNQMADKIEVARKWIQYPGTPKEHYDISLSKRRLAIQLGAIQITWMQLSKVVYKRSKKHVLH